MVLVTELLLGDNDGVGVSLFGLGAVGGRDHPFLVASLPIFGILDYSSMLWVWYLCLSKDYPSIHRCSV